LPAKGFARIGIRLVSKKSTAEIATATDPIPKCLGKILVGVEQPLAPSHRSVTGLQNFQCEEAGDSPTSFVGCY
jgi:hypothetical protein